MPTPPSNPVCGPNAPGTPGGGRAANVTNVVCRGTRRGSTGAPTEPRSTQDAAQSVPSPLGSTRVSVGSARTGVVLSLGDAGGLASIAGLFAAVVAAVQARAARKAADRAEEAAREAEMAGQVRVSANEIQIGIGALGQVMERLRGSLALENRLAVEYVLADWCRQCSHLIGLMDGSDRFSRFKDDAFNSIVTSRSVAAKMHSATEPLRAFASPAELAMWSLLEELNAELKRSSIDVRDSASLK